MLRSPITRWLVGIVAFIAVLGVLRFKPWHYGSVGEMFSGRFKVHATGIEGRLLARHLPPDLSRNRFRHQDQHYQSV